MLDSSAPEETQLESLGLASTAPKSDGRLKALLWPTICHDGDLEYITEQGFWICLIVGLLSFALTVIQGHPFSALLTLTFYFLAGAGVRQRRKAASIVGTGKDSFQKPIERVQQCLGRQRWWDNSKNRLPVLV